MSRKIITVASLLAILVIVLAYIVLTSPRSSTVLTITASLGGTTNPAPDTYTYIYGTNVSVNAAADVAHVFDHWELDTANVGTTNPYTITMNANHTLKALFSTPSSTVLLVDPQTVQGAKGHDFTINVSISNVVDLYGWEFKLNWNPLLLDVINITEGPTLRSKGSTFFSPTVNSTDGHLRVDCTLLGDISGFSGQGTLMTIEFYVKENGTGDLNLYDTQLLNSNAQQIALTVHDGHFSA